MLLAAFAPLYAGATAGLASGVTVSATTSAQNSSLPNKSAGNNQLRVVNMTQSIAFLNFGGTAVTAVAASTALVMLPMTVEVYTIDATVTNVSYALQAGSGSLSFMWGEGI
jgi:ABC-type transport system involved in Fe-S cluster assembly fused permease/ATPase subunit